MNGNDEYLELALTDCCVGEEGQVIGIDADCALSCRLRELGIETGANIRVVQSGSPVIIRCGETRLCLRAEQAASIRLRMTPFPVITPEFAPAAEASRTV